MSKCSPFAIANKCLNGITQHFVIQYKVMITVKEDKSTVCMVGVIFGMSFILANVYNCSQMLCFKE